MNAVSEELIREKLCGAAKKFNLHILDRVGSTNALLREKADNGAASGTVVIAGEQTAGRGRMGRSFFSPDGTGLYISVLFRPDIPAEKTVFITTSAAVAVCKAIETLSGKHTGIKWVNDIFIDGKKICGILTEAAIGEKGLDYAVLGIGVNVFTPHGGFPDTIKATAGAIFGEYSEGIREALAAEILNEVSDIFANDGLIYIDEYRKRSVVIGKNITVIRGGESFEAFAEDIDDECRLIVRKRDGVREAVSSGEVSIRVF